MKILIVGGGGREHALAWKAAQSSKVEMVYVAPGNAGTANEDKVTNIEISADDINALKTFAKKEEIELTIVGPEAPLVDGIVDDFQESGLRCFGPTKAAAELEGSKSFCKNFLKKFQIPTAEYEVFTEENLAIDYVKSKKMPIVIKADGLAAGKGVVIASSQDEAIKTIKEMLSGNKFGDAGHRIVIEEFLEGEEVSYIVISDGKNVLPLATSQDHKARDDGDMGPNTGGMGAYSPAPIANSAIQQRILEEVILPTIKGMESEGRTYTGFLYAGLMVTNDGNLKVLEFNCRFGDPETQPIMMRLKSDLVSMCLASFDNTLTKCNIDWDSRSAVGVVSASDGYPASASKGDIIEGLNSIFPEYIKIFHAGTSMADGNIVTAGGRVLCATALGDTVSQAKQKAYDAINEINYDGMFFRNDIGYRAIQREN
ncbi:MAG: phosphoribosylamine--glycine ligase [Legionellales bacterium]|jgi:phosphoribosylamine--glycine ligase|nr:phosphoribosylamine--glycine ligase [Legionellales bacterium]|tara:strand:- start:963 stop:2246 length:1284 start_codon:yes stop_codon:yes gene_type:complete